MFSNIPKPKYWDAAAKTIAMQGQSSKTQFAWYDAAWRDLENSTTPPEEKAIAAREFIKLYEHNKAPNSLIEYKDVEFTNLSRASVNFTSALEGNGAIAAFNLKAGVATDVAVNRAVQLGALPTGFVVNFEKLYGVQAAAELKDKYRVESTIGLEGPRPTKGK